MRETHSCEWLINNLICGAAYKGKEALLREFFVLVSLFLLLHSVGVMTIRIVTASSSPATEPDHKYINVLNQIMRNTIEQLFIFTGLFLYLLYEKAGTTPTTQATASLRPNWGCSLCGSSLGECSSQ